MSSKYGPEFKHKIVKLHLEEERSLRSIATEFGISKASITNWCNEFNEECEAQSKNDPDTKTEADFTRLASENSRERTDAKYGGAFYEFGPSVLVPIIKLLGTDYKNISFHSIFDRNGVDEYDKMNIYYDDAMASARTGVAVKTEGQLVIAGTKGYILAQSPWWLTKHFEVRYEDSAKIESYDPPFRGDGLRYEISEFIRKIAGFSRNGYKLTSDESIFMAEIIEKYTMYKEHHSVKKSE